MTNEQENLAGVLLEILDDAEIERGKKHDLLMQKLVSFITRRDHKVFNHAFKLGEDKQRAANQNQAKK